MFSFLLPLCLPVRYMYYKFTPQHPPGYSMLIA